MAFVLRPQKWSLAQPVRLVEEHGYEIGPVHPGHPPSDRIAAAPDDVADRCQEIIPILYGVLVQGGTG
jgi:hypothetical protein